MVGKRELLRDLRNGRLPAQLAPATPAPPRCATASSHGGQGHPASQVEALGDVFLPDLVASRCAPAGAVTAEHAAAGGPDRALSQPNRDRRASPTARASPTVAAPPRAATPTASTTARRRPAARLAGRDHGADGGRARLRPEGQIRLYRLSERPAVLEGGGSSVVVHPEPELHCVPSPRIAAGPSSRPPRSPGIAPVVPRLTQLAGNGITAAATKLGRGAKIAFSRTVRRSTPRTATRGSPQPPHLLEGRVGGLAGRVPEPDLGRDDGQPEKARTPRRSASPGTPAQCAAGTATTICSRVGMPGALEGCRRNAWNTASSSACTQQASAEARSISGSPTVASSQSSTATGARVSGPAPRCRSASRRG